MARLSRRLLTFLALAIGAAFVVPAMTAFGHAAYDHSTPNADEVVTTPPTQVDAFFKEEIKREAGTYYLRVSDVSGTAVSDGDGTLDDNDRTHMIATIPTTLPDGRYVANYRTVSDEDGDEGEGGFCFYVNVQPTAADTAACAALSPTEEPAQTGSPEATAPEATPTVAPVTNDDGDDSNTGIIIGVIVAIAVVVVVVGCGALYLRQRQQG